MPHRREFLKAGTALAGALVVPHFRVHADDKAGTRPAVIGSAEHRYECNHHWGELPRGLQWETTHGVAVDSAGFLYVTHQGHGPNVLDTVVVFDPKGKFVRSFGKELFGGGHGIDLRREAGMEVLYLSDFVHGVVVRASLKGEILSRQGVPKEAMAYGRDAKFKPTNVAFGPDGGLFIADGYGANFIHRYDANGRWVKALGGTGTLPGQFRTPHGVWWDDRPSRTPHLLVADRANARLQWLTVDGKVQEELKDVLFPAHFDLRGELLLVADLHGRVSLFDGCNRPIVHLGDDAAWIAEVKKLQARNNPSQWPAGKFVHPHDACFDAEGNIFVAEWVTTGRLSRLRRVT